MFSSLYPERRALCKHHQALVFTRRFMICNFICVIHFWLTACVGYTDSSSRWDFEIYLTSWHLPHPDLNETFLLFCCTALWRSRSPRSGPWDSRARAVCETPVSVACWQVEQAVRHRSPRTSRHLRVRWPPRFPLSSSFPSTCFSFSWVPKACSHLL